MTRKKSTPSAKRPRPVPQRATSNSSQARLALGRAREAGEALFPVPPTKEGLPESYSLTLNELRQRIEEARLRAVIDANATMTQLYWNIGRIILARQEAEGWGAKVVGHPGEARAAPRPPHLARDRHPARPRIRGEPGGAGHGAARPARRVTWRPPEVRPVRARPEPSSPRASVAPSLPSRTRRPARAARLLRRERPTALTTCPRLPSRRARPRRRRPAIRAPCPTTVAQRHADRHPPRVRRRDGSDRSARVQYGALHRHAGARVRGRARALAAVLVVTGCTGTIDDLFVTLPQATGVPDHWRWSSFAVGLDWQQEQPNS